MQSPAHLEYGEAKLCVIAEFREFIGGRIRLHASGRHSKVGAARIRSDDAAGRLVGAAAPHVHRARARSSSMRRGRHFRVSTTSSGLTCRPSTHRCSSATGRTAGSARKPGWWPAALPFSAALLILWAPGGFRFTCYYYRGAYYKAFWADPPSCAVGEPRKKYLGEQSFPLILQNIHRYFLYLAHPLSLRPDLRRLEGDVVHRRGRADDVRDRRRHARAGGRTRCSSAATPSDAIRSGTSSAACSISSRSIRRGSRCTTPPTASIAGT